MNYYHAKISCPKPNDPDDDYKFGNILEKSLSNEIFKEKLNNIPNHLNSANEGDIVFLKISGDNSHKRNYFDKEELQNFTNGIYGICIIENIFPEDKDLEVEIYGLSEPITEKNLYFFPQFIDSLGGRTKGTANQAGLYTLDEATGKSLIDYIKINEIEGASKELTDQIDANGLLKSHAKEIIKTDPELLSNRSKSVVNEITSFTDTNSSGISKFVITSFVKWFKKDENYKKSYGGVMIPEVLNFWDNYFFNANIFNLDPEKINESVNLIKKAYNNSSKEWSKYSNAVSKGMPNAILGSENYLKFLDEKTDDSEFISKLKVLKSKSRFQTKSLNRVLYGPPGTGKTFALRNEFSDKFTSASNLKNFVFTTFHQSFTYEDFIEGIKPVLESESISYIIEPGIFLKACDNACKLAGFNNLDDCLKKTEEERVIAFSQAGQYAIFIDEINRGNIASIFGELITLIEEDKRLTAKEELILELPYSKKKFGVPPNLHLIGTMNTADRSVEAIDTALRRRFVFDEVPPKPDLVDQLSDSDGIIEDLDLNISLGTLLATINKRIEKLIDKDHLIGHSYFINIKTCKDLRVAFSQKIIPLLEEYFYGDKGKIQLVLGKGFIRMIDDDSTAFPDNQYDDSAIFQSREIYHITSDWQTSDSALHEAIRLCLN